MERILDGLKSGMIWADNVNVDVNALISMDNSNASKGSTISVMDLGKMLLGFAKDGDTPKVHELMSRGAPFTTDWLGTSPLHLAATHNHIDTCEVLLRAGISKDARTKVDRTPLHLAVYEGHEAIVELLLKNKCDVNAKDMLKMTPLHWAVEKRFPRIVNLLLQHGADPVALSKFEKTPITLAFESKQNDILQELSAHKGRVEEQAATDSLMNEMEKDNYNNIHSDDMETDMISSSPESSPTQSQSSFHPLANSSMAASQKQNMSRGVDSPALQILKDHGISMIPDDTDNTVLNSALQSGRKLILSDAGKLILNYPKGTKNGTNSTDHFLHNIMKADSAARKKPPLMVPALSPPKNAALKTNKVIKILSAEEFNKMCGGKGGNSATTFKKVLSDSPQNGSLRLDPNTLSSINKNNKRAVMNKCKISTLPNSVKQQISNDIKFSSMQPVSIKNLTNLQRISKQVVVTNNATDKQLIQPEVPKRILISSTSPVTDIASTSSTNVVNFATAGTTTNSAITLKPANAPNRNQAMVTIPRNTLADIMRQLVELKNHTDDLRKQMEIQQKQNEDYRLRLERLEKERDRDTVNAGQYTNSDY